MGKYASREATSGVSVAWGDITDKPAVFTPASHNNTAHSTEYAPAASPQFSGTSKFIGFSATSGAGNLNITNATYPNSGWAFRIGDNAAVIDLIIDRENAGWSECIRFKRDTGNVVFSANVIAAKLQTTNWSLEEDGNDLIIKRGSTVLARLSSAGAWNTLGGQECDDATP